jgi:hypothetical protein
LAENSVFLQLGSALKTNQSEKRQEFGFSIFPLPGLPYRKADGKALGLFPYPSIQARSIL